MDRLRQRLASFTDMYTGSRQQGLLRPETRGGEARILFASMYWYGKETGIARGSRPTPPPFVQAGPATNRASMLNYLAGEPSGSELESLGRGTGEYEIVKETSND